MEDADEAIVRNSGVIRRAVLVIGVALALVVLLAVGIHTALKNNTLGGDFYIFWKAGRAFFLSGLTRTVGK